MVQVPLQPSKAQRRIANRVRIPSGTATVSAEVSLVDESRSLDRFCSEKARGDLRGASQETCLCYVFTETLQVRRIGLIGAEKRLRHPFGVPRFFFAAHRRAWGRCRQQHTPAARPAQGTRRTLTFAAQPPQTPQNNTERKKTNEKETSFPASLPLHGAVPAPHGIRRQ